MSEYDVFNKYKKRDDDDFNWFGSVDKETGIEQKGAFMPVVNTALSAIGAYTNWQSLSEAKRNNAQARASNIINSTNAKKAYDFDVDRIMGGRMKASGKSDEEISAMQNSDEYKKKYHARSL